MDRQKQLSLDHSFIYQSSNISSLSPISLSMSFPPTLPSPVTADPNNTIDNLESESLDDILSGDFQIDNMDINSFHNWFASPDLSADGMRTPRGLEIPHRATHNSQSMDLNSSYFAGKQKLCFVMTSRTSTAITSSIYIEQEIPPTTAEPLGSLDWMQFDSITAMPENLLQSLSQNELSAMWYYLHTVLSQQFPFADGRTTQDLSTHLFELLTKSKLCISTILCHGIYSQQSQLSKFGFNAIANFDESAATYERSAIQALQERLRESESATAANNGSCRDFKCVEIQVCVAQILLYKVSLLPIDGINGSEPTV
jgi:hypothetical protein